MYKTIISAVALGAAALSPLLAGAADDARSAIHISANIPNKQFHVQPRNPDFGKNEVMHMDPVSRKLTWLRETFDVKNTDGSVHAYTDGAVWLSNGTHSIVLAVTFNNVQLGDTPREVVDDATSTPGTQAELVVLAPFPVSPRLSGQFNANFTVIFDAVPRISL
ncbi:adhesin [Pseudomonas alvandae]|uniref:adhesin n=1 Tax=Pseudomonas TaxID=286 RepID=UPI00389B0746